MSKPKYDDVFGNVHLYDIDGVKGTSDFVYFGKKEAQLGYMCAAVYSSRERYQGKPRYYGLVSFSTMVLVYDRKGRRYADTWGDRSNCTDKHIRRFYNWIHEHNVEDTGCSISEHVINRDIHPTPTNHFPLVSALDWQGVPSPSRKTRVNIKVDVVDMKKTARRLSSASRSDCCAVCYIDSAPSWGICRLTRADPYVIYRTWAKNGAVSVLGKVKTFEEAEKLLREDYFIYKTTRLLESSAA